MVLTEKDDSQECSFISEGKIKFSQQKHIRAILQEIVMGISLSKRKESMREVAVATQPGKSLGAHWPAGTCHTSSPRGRLGMCLYPTFLYPAAFLQGWRKSPGGDGWGFWLNIPLPKCNAAKGVNHGTRKHASTEKGREKEKEPWKNCLQKMKTRKMRRVQPLMK